MASFEVMCTKSAQETATSHTSLKLFFDTMVSEEFAAECRLF
jgi:hypothetical protein